MINSTSEMERSDFQKMTWDGPLGLYMTISKWPHSVNSVTDVSLSTPSSVNRISWHGHFVIWWWGVFVSLDTGSRQRYASLTLLWPMNWSCDWNSRIGNRVDSEFTSSCGPARCRVTQQTRFNFCLVTYSYSWLGIRSCNDLLEHRASTTFSSWTTRFPTAAN